MKMSEYIKKKDAVEIVEHNLSRFMIAMKIGGFDSEEEIAPIKYGRLLYKGPVFFVYGNGEKAVRGVNVCNECKFSWIQGDNFCPNCGVKFKGK